MKGERQITLRDGTPGIVRAIVPTDGEALAGALEELGPESRTRRFLFDKTKLTPAEIDRLSNPDGRDHLAYGVAVETGEGMTPISVARCFRDKEQPDLAEIAIVTADAWQGKGAGAELIATLREAALGVGIRRWFGAMFADSDPMKRLLARYGRKCEERDLGNGVIEAIYDISVPARDSGSVS